jgi:hypothetical protein
VIVCQILLVLNRIAAAELQQALHIDLIACHFHAGFSLLVRRGARCVLRDIVDVTEGTHVANRLQLALRVLLVVALSLEVLPGLVRGCDWLGGGSDEFEALVVHVIFLSRSLFFELLKLASLLVETPSLSF